MARLGDGRVSYWGRGSRLQRQRVEVRDETLLVLTGDGELRRVMEVERQVREEKKARIEAGGVPAAVGRGKRPRRPQGDTRWLAEVSARQMARHRGG